MRAFLLTMFVMLSVRLLSAQSAGDLVPEPMVPPVEDVDSATIARIKDQALHLQWSVGYLQSVAQNQLRTGLDSINAPAAGYGFGFEIGRYFDPVPVFVGAEVGVVFIPSDDRTIPASQQRSYSVTTSNVMFPIMTTIRFQPSIMNWVYPYAEFVSGIHVFSSDVTVKRIVQSDTTTDNAASSADFNWNYGFGLGAAVKVADVITLPNSLQRTLIDVRFRYITGSSVTVPYANLVDDETLDYAMRESFVARPSFVTFRLGLTFHL